MGCGCQPIRNRPMPSLTSECGGAMNPHGCTKKLVINERSTQACKHVLASQTFDSADMPPKKSAESLRKVLHMTENEEKRDRLEKALLEVQELKKSGKKASIHQIALKHNVSHSTLGHQANGCTSK